MHSNSLLSTLLKPVRSRTWVRITIAAIAASLLIFPALTKGQVSTAQLSGSLHDPSGAMIPGAEVSATQTATGVVTTTTANGQGLFTLPTLAVGPYTIKVTASGFVPYRQTGVVLTVGQELTLEIALKIGASNQEVTVTADTVALDATSPTQQSTVEQAVVEGLPLDGRNVAQLAYTVAGVTDSTQAIPGGSSNPTTSIMPGNATNPDEIAPAIHGVRAGGVYFSLDGANNTDPFTVIGGPFPNPDATQEFSVVTGTYGARYVSAPGGAINIVTRSGTNQVHGSAFEFIRNPYFNARNAESTIPDQLHRNTYGFAAGAPLIQDKLFVFASFQNLVTHDSHTNEGFFPTAAMRAGTFPNPDGTTFTIPSYFLTSAQTGSTAQLLKLLPTPPASDVSGFTSYASPYSETDKQGLLKLDYDLKNHRIFLRGFYDRFNEPAQGPSPTGGIASEGQGLLQPWLSVAVGDTYTHGKWIFDSRASLLKQWSDELQAPQNLSFSNLDMAGMSGYGSNPGIGLIYVLGGFYAGIGTPAYFPRKIFELSEDAYAVKGKHQLSFGVNYRHTSFNESNFNGEGPAVVYYGSVSQAYMQYGLIPGAETSSALEDLILGNPVDMAQSDSFFINLGGSIFGAYGEDNYRLTDKLTLTGGLRWDPFVPYSAQNGQVTCFTPEQQSSVFPNAFPGLLFGGDSGCPKNGIPSKLNNFQPRVGVAYQLSPKTVVRSGYGMYDLQFPLNAYNGFNSSQPWVRDFQAFGFLSLDNLWANTAYGTNPFAAGFHQSGYKTQQNTTFVNQLGVSGFNQDFKQAYVHQWSFSVQQLLSPKDSLEATYVGTEGTHLTIGTSLNTAIYENDPITGAPPMGGPGGAANEQDRMPYQHFKNISSMQSTATSSFNGLDVTFRHRSDRFTLTPAFSWSKSIDNNSQPGFASNIAIPNSNHNFRRGLSDNDQNILLKATGTLNGPSLKDMNAAMRAIVGSWNLSGLLAVNGGLPFTVTDGNDQSATGLGIDYADRVSGQPLWIPRDSNLIPLGTKELNPAAFRDNAPGTFGDSGRNAYRNPMNTDVDLAASKNFHINERLQMVFRAESFNLLNHPNYHFGPQVTFSTNGLAGGMGTYSAMDPRRMQFSLKAMF